MRIRLWRKKLVEENNRTPVLPSFLAYLVRNKLLASLCVFVYFCFQVLFLPFSFPISRIFWPAAVCCFIFFTFFISIEFLFRCIKKKTCFIFICKLLYLHAQICKLYKVQIFFAIRSPINDTTKTEFSLSISLIGKRQVSYTYLFERIQLIDSI